MVMTRRLAECLIRLRNDPEMSAFREWLEANIESERDRLMNIADDKTFRCVQGRAQAFSELKFLIGEAPKLLEKVRGQ